MTALTDPRPHVFMEAKFDDERPPQSSRVPGLSASELLDEAQVAGLLLTDLLETYPDIDLPTVRIWQHTADGRPTIRVDARRGELAAVECPQCHQPAGRPHTDYCTLDPERVWNDQL